MSLCSSPGEKRADVNGKPVSPEIGRRSLKNSPASFGDGAGPLVAPGAGVNLVEVDT